MVFYRKYRPQKIDDLDCAQVREKLSSILSKDPPHAFLFTGPKGLGKTSAARIVAKAVNCEIKNQESRIKNQGNKYSVEPCNECEQCKSITNGTNMDVIEIDAASNRGIDEIRDLREKIWLSPLKANRKVYIIDEVHMLTTEAFNALLKILEEPPGHALFILCTTEPQKVPSTILSRCFHIVFAKATEDELIRSLKRILAGEKIVIKKGQEDKILRNIAKMSEGGFRDAAKILEELSLSASGKEIGEELVESIYKTTAISSYIENLFAALNKRDVKKCFEIIGSAYDQGIEFRNFISMAMENIHEQLLEQLGAGGKKNGRPYRFTIDEIKQIAVLFSKAYADMKYAVIPQLPLELAVIEFVESNRKAVESGDEATLAGLRKQVNAKLKMKAINGVSGEEDKPDAKKREIKAEVELAHVPAKGEATKEWLEALRRGLIDEMKQFNHTIAGVMRSCQLVSYNEKKLVIGAAYEFHKERLDEAKARAALVKVCRKLTGNDVEIEVKLRRRD